MGQLIRYIAQYKLTGQLKLAVKRESQVPGILCLALVFQAAVSTLSYSLPVPQQCLPMWLTRFQFCSKCLPMWLTRFQFRSNACLCGLIASSSAANVCLCGLLASSSAAMLACVLFEAESAVKNSVHFLGS